jgi:FixJ family two-component response regulator
VISIVDDDPMVRDAVCDLLGSLGYIVCGFESAEQFLDSSQVNNTTCLITDLNLPGLSGVELQRQLKDDGCRVPIIFITAFPDPKTRQRALSNGAIAFLTKPFDDSALMDSLSAALRGSLGSKV